MTLTPKGAGMCADRGMGDSACVFGLFTLGFRHGFDVDHLAAISDIAGSQFLRLRAFLLSTLYAAGHAATVAVLGLGIAWAGWEVPDAGRLVGATLVILGTYVLWCVATKRRPAARGGIVVRATRRLRVLVRPTTVVEHEHEHHHADSSDRMHEHIHADGDAGESGSEFAAVTTRHRHRHRHENIPAPYGAAGAVFVGLVHGIGVETPTQVLALAAGTKALLPFLAGLFLANTVVALVAVVGLTEGRLRLLNTFVGGLSLYVGVSYLLGGSPPGAW